MNKISKERKKISNTSLPYTVVLRLTEEERKMADILKEKYSVNISNLMRQTIKKYFDKMEEME